MTKPHLASIRQRLWPDDTGREVWVILDGARDNRIYAHVLDTYLESSCLYAGTLPPALEAAAPYLVQLECDDRLTTRVLEQGWGKSWGIFLKSPANLGKLRRHLREFLLVLDPSGKRMAFRYYDPRVLRAYLPTCTPTELDTLFGPIDIFWTEGPDPGTLIEFRRDDRKLHQQTIPLDVYE